MNREDFHPQVGDMVRIREWDDMASEFGIAVSGNIKCRFSFTKEMKFLCGQEFCITSIGPNNRYYGDYDVRGYSISIDMIEPANEYLPDEEVDSTVIDEFLSTIKVV